MKEKSMLEQYGNNATIIFFHEMKWTIPYDI